MKPRHWSSARAHSPLMPPPQHTFPFLCALMMVKMCSLPSLHNLLATLCLQTRTAIVRRTCQLKDATDRAVHDCLWSLHSGCRVTTGPHQIQQKGWFFSPSSLFLDRGPHQPPLRWWRGCRFHFFPTKDNQISRTLQVGGRRLNAREHGC